jgi:hypothetical protein
LQTINSHQRYQATALLDSGCTGSVISRRYIHENKIATKQLERPLAVRNADGTPNTSGMIQEYIEVHVIIGDHKEMLQLAVTELGNDDLFLGFDWLQHHNPLIDWTKSKLSFDRCPSTCHQGTIDDLSYLQKFQFWSTTWTEYITWKEEEIRQINIQRSSVAMDLAIEQEKKREKKPWYLIVPDDYHEYEAVFTRETFDQLPQHSTWDHPIDLKPDSKPTKGKVYPLAPNEQIELDKFLEENCHKLTL